MGSRPSNLNMQFSRVCAYTHTYAHIHYGPFEFLQILVDQSQLEKSTGTTEWGSSAYTPVSEQVTWLILALAFI